MTESAKKPETMARLVIVLFVVTAVVALLLGLVDFLRIRMFVIVAEDA